MTYTVLSTGPVQVLDSTGAEVSLTALLDELQELRAALRAQEDRAEGLDVERLAEFIREQGWVADRTALDDHIPWSEWERSQSIAMAEALVARLTPDRTPTEEER